MRVYGPCVYTHTNIITGDIFYVGYSSSCKARPYQKRGASRNAKWHQYVDDKLSGNTDQVSVDIKNFSTEAKALQYERELIEKLRPIANILHNDGTSVIERDLLGGKIRQNTKTGMFSVSDINDLGNAHRVKNGLSEKQIASYFHLDATKELIKEICLEESLELHEVKLSKRGKAGGTWAHPILFMDIAMWYSPKFIANVLRLAASGLLDSEENANDSFKAMNAELNANFPTECGNPIIYTRVANKISEACRVGTGKKKWEKASVDQLKLRSKIQENVCLLADVTENVGSCVSKAINKALATTNTPIK